ncbi:MAG: outer membrane protein transport protein [Bacteroidetes bacterium]|nr:outer membrane protein transport protein [Bacteroidota bacterium]
MKNLLVVLLVLISTLGLAQTGTVMQGAGAVNMSMGGAATAQPTDISGALLWNPAAISSFNQKILSINAGAFSSSPELSSSLPAGMLGPGAPAVSGTTKDDRGLSVMPALSMVFGKENSKHTFGVSAFGVSGFGVTFPQEPNNPLSPSFDPTKPSNPINYPQQAGGFGHLESDYMVLQVAVAWSYKLSDKFSVGVQPMFNYAGLKLLPNPLSSPDPAKGYPVSERATATGFGGQLGLFYDSHNGIKLGASYKTGQSFSKFTFKNTYLDNSAAPESSFTMNYPAILSVGAGYSKGKVDVALDYRRVFYSSTQGFKEKGWTATGSVNGFGWNDMSVVSFGLQYKGIEKLPLRVGYTYSSNPINNDLVMFSAPAPAVIKNAYQLGLGYVFSDKVTLNAVYHYGTSGGSTYGQLLSPMAVTGTNPYGAIPGSSVSYSMTTSMIMLGLNYTFVK